MAERKPFLLRLDPELHRALQRWADDDLRSLNGQIEFLLRKALRDAGRERGREGGGEGARKGTTDASGASPPDNREKNSETD